MLLSHGTPQLISRGIINELLQPVTRYPILLGKLGVRGILPAYSLLLSEFIIILSHVGLGFIKPLLAVAARRRLQLDNDANVHEIKNLATLACLISPMVHV